ncbi:MAG: winged helix-turn-helix domain-containing protein, partial [bacterium]
MPIPDYQTLMRPLLEILSDGREHSLKELVESLAIKYALSEEERILPLPSGQQSVFHNRVSWAKTYLKNAGLVESTGRGISKITTEGLNFLKRHQGTIFARNLEQFPKFQNFKNKNTRTVNEEEVADANITFVKSLTPMEQIESAFNETLQTTQVELLDRLKKCSPAFFEHIVVDLLLKMGYGGITGKGEVTQFSNDGGL